MLYSSFYTWGCLGPRTLHDFLKITQWTAASFHTVWYLPLYTTLMTWKAISWASLFPKRSRMLRFRNSDIQNQGVSVDRKNCRKEKEQWMRQAIDFPGHRESNYVTVESESRSGWNLPGMPKASMTQVFHLVVHGRVWCIHVELLKCY